MPQTWRWIPPLQAPGVVQMALDAWLLDQHEQGLAPPTLRFYTWQPIALSLGYHQRQIPDHWRHLSWRGEAVELVRRPSGGRAVLHQGDLTYALVVSGLSGNREQVYRQVCEFLVQGWRSLSVPLHFGTAGRGYIHNPNCFGTATGADLLLGDGTKLIGSAQLRRGPAILQHGSMALNLDPTLYEQIFGVAASTPALPLTQEWERRQQQVIEALTAAAADVFGATWKELPLSAIDWDAVNARVPAFQFAG